MTATIPPEVELVRGFSNTLDVDAWTDALATPDGLATWLADAGLVEAGAVATGRDLALAHRLRSAVRRLLEANHADADADEAAAALADVAASLPLVLSAGPEALAPAGEGVRAGLARVVAAMVTARLRGELERLRLCAADDCKWAFYDTSRNRSRRWCSMEVCGNRSKVRAYRDRSQN